MMLPLLYVSRLDLPDGAEPAFAEWYTRKHAPDLVAAGFLSVSSFRAVQGSPRVCNLYELRDLDAFGPAYEEARAADTEGPQTTEGATDRSLAVYEQLVTGGVPAGGSGPQWRTAIVAPVVTTLRFSATDDEGVLEWCRGQELGRIMAMPGSLSVRLGRQVDAGRPDVDPRRWCLFAEWANLAAGTAWAQTTPGELFDPSIHVLERRSVLHHMDAWEA
jgi:hypothetical protein